MVAAVYAAWESDMDFHASRQMVGTDVAPALVVLQDPEPDQQVVEDLRAQVQPRPQPFPGPSEQDFVVLAPAQGHLRALVRA